MSKLKMVVRDVEWRRGQGVFPHRIIRRMKMQGARLRYRCGAYQLQHLGVTAFCTNYCADVLVERWCDNARCHPVRGAKR